MNQPYLNRCLIAVTAVSTFAAATAEANPSLQFDVNGLTSQVSGPFSTTYTGDLLLSDDSNSSALLFIDNSFSGYFAGAGEFDFDGTISFVSGNVTGGSFVITDLSSADTYSASISPQGFIFVPVSNGPFKVDGFTFNGAFSDNDFDGIDVSGFNQTIDGTFSEILIGPFSDGVDTQTDIDIFGTVVPEPSSLALLALGGLAMMRRRR